MFADTAGLSFVLGVFFIFISLTGVILFYFIVKSDAISSERIDKIAELGKWFIVSVAVTFSVSIVNDSFREREQDVKELQVFEKYVDIVLEADSLDKRKGLVEYFAAVSPDGSIKASWNNYKIVVDGQIAQVEANTKRLSALATKLAEGKIGPSEIVEKARLEVQTSTITQSLASTSRISIPIILIGADMTHSGALGEVQRAARNGHENAQIFRRNGFWRTAIPFDTEASARAAFPAVKEFSYNNGAVLVNTSSWCPNQEPRMDSDGPYIVCLD